jgi:hypothetical protein
MKAKKSRSKIIYVLCGVMRNTSILPYKIGVIQFSYDIPLYLAAYVLWWCAAAGVVDLSAKYANKCLSFCLSIYVTKTTN